jgi:hypothetical protein
MTCDTRFLCHQKTRNLDLRGLKFSRHSLNQLGHRIQTSNLSRYTVFLYWRVFAPEILDVSYRILFLPSGEKPALTRKIVQMVGTEAFNMPEPGTQARATEEKKMT